MKHLLCWIGFHRRALYIRWIPSIDAPTVEGFAVTRHCTRCSKTITEFVAPQ